MSWQDEPATWRQKLALRNAIDMRYGNRQGREIYDELDGDHMTKAQASAEIDRLYKLKQKRISQFGGKYGRNKSGSGEGRQNSI